MEFQNKTLLGVVIYVKASDLNDIKKGHTIITWYEKEVPETFVHGGWIQVLVSYEYYNIIKEAKDRLDLIANDLIL